ncbi:MAG: thioredoxin-disulfide reductase [Tissierellia bacterium]|nr:thioredoxin-disulfide reductase [Tissierellia bacterium]
MNKTYDVIIIGAGPAGLSAGLYAARAKLSTLIIEKGIDGGQMSGTQEIANYPGIDDPIAGMILGMKMANQAKEFGAEKLLSDVLKMKLDGEIKEIETLDGTFYAKAVILTMGNKPRPIGVENEEKFQGRGLSYCVTCDGAFYQDRHVYVIGGGDAAVEEAISLTKFAKKVTIIHRRDELRAAKSIQEKAFANPKVAFMWDSVVESLHGEKSLESMVVKNVKTGETTTVTDDDGLPLGVFLYIGFLPQTDLIENQINMDRGYIVTDENMETSIKGVYAAGDIRVKPLRQVVTAVSDGAIAAVSVEKYLEENK